LLLFRAAQAEADVSPKITVEQVQTAVRRYFQVLSEKTTGELADMYTYDSLVFGRYLSCPTGTTEVI